MALRLLGHVELPANRSSGGFDHADIHPPTDRLYVAHTSNDSIDVIDCAQIDMLNRSRGLRVWQALSCPRRAVSSLHPIEVKTLFRFSRQVPSETRSRSGWA